MKYLSEKSGNFLPFFVIYEEDSAIEKISLNLLLKKNVTQ